MENFKNFPKFFKDVDNRMELVEKLIESEEEIKCLEKLLKEAKERKKKFICEYGEYNPGWGEWIYDLFSEASFTIYDYLNYYATLQTNR